MIRDLDNERRVSFDLIAPWNRLNKLYANVEADTLAELETVTDKPIGAIGVVDEASAVHVFDGQRWGWFAKLTPAEPLR